MADFIHGDKKNNDKSMHSYYHYNCRHIRDRKLDIRVNNNNNNNFNRTVLDVNPGFAGHKCSVSFTERKTVPEHINLSVRFVTRASL